MTGHGQLPCPDCGYQRRGLPRAQACPECGAPGFRGDFTVSGEPEVHDESRRAGGVAAVARFLLFTSVYLCSWFFGRNSVWGEWISIAGVTLFALALAIYLLGRARRRRDAATGISLERVVWDFTPDGIVLRRNGSERIVAYRDIDQCWSAINFVSRRTKVQLFSVRAEPSIGSALDTMLLGGALSDQRLAVAEIKRRVTESKGATAG